MRAYSLFFLAVAVPAVHGIVIGGHPRPRGIPQVDTFDTLGTSIAGTPPVFEDGPFVGGIEYFDLDIPIEWIRGFIVQTFGFFSGKAVIGGIVPHSYPNVATLPQGKYGRMVALAYYDDAPPCTRLSSSYIACSVITYNTVFVVPLAVPLACKVTWELYNDAGNVTREVRQQEYLPDVAKVSPTGIGYLATGNIDGFLKSSPITSSMQQMRLDFSLGRKWGVRAEILDLPLALPAGLPDNVASYLNETILSSYQNSLQLHIDDVTYTVVGGVC